jgi:ATP synthase protein I
MTKDRNDGPSAFFRAAGAASLGLEMGAAVAIGLAIGWWLDSRLGTAPWLMLVFLLLGIAAGFKGVYTTARKLQRQAQEREHGKDEKKD